MTIDINGFDRGSIRDAIRQLEKVMNGKSDEACMRVAEYGAKVASERFVAAAPSYDGNYDVSVVAESIPNGARVHASGQSVAFVEYGAGAIYPNYPGVDPYGRGSWSMGPDGKGHWNDPNGWYYAHGKKSWGNPPAAAMFHAEQAMRDNASDIARGVIK